VGKPRHVPTPAPAFWFGFEVAWAKLVVGRVVLFGLLALDALLAIRHAPRYGAGGFNVAQLPGLDGLGPTRLSYLTCELINALLFTFAALGVGTRLVVPLATAIYAWLYLGSHLDSYQHHYLVTLILLLASFVPWERPADATPATPIKSWALRLILVQLGILYFYAAISKFDPAWLDGRALGGQVFTPGAWFDLRGLVDHTIGIRAMAHVVVIVELALAAMVWIPQAWFIAAPLGILFHLGIVLSKLEIGLFAWLMIGIYAFVVPDRVWLWLADRALGRAVRTAIARLTNLLDRAPRAGAGHRRALVGAAAVLAGLGLAFMTRTDHALAVALALVPLPFLAAAAANRLALAGRIGAALFVTFGLWFAVDRLSDATTDYYKFWAGSSRRLGDLDAAEQAYRRLTTAAPRDGGAHFQLGRLLLARGDELDGMAELHEAEQLEPTRARAWLEEARFLETHQRHDAALAAAQTALKLEPNSPEAKALIATLTGQAAVKVKPGGAGDDE